MCTASCPECGMFCIVAAESVYHVHLENNDSGVVQWSATVKPFPSHGPERLYRSSTVE
jgi:hypothetical protein